MPYISQNISADTKAVTTTAEALAASTARSRELLLQSDPDNATNVIVGDANSQTIVLTPGQSLTLPILSPGLIYVKMASGTGTVNWLTRD